MTIQSAAESMVSTVKLFNRLRLFTIPFTWVLYVKIKPTCEILVNLRARVALGTCFFLKCNWPCVGFLCTEHADTERRAGDMKCSEQTLEAELDGQNETNQSLPKAKTRKHDDAYVSAWPHCDYRRR